MSRPTVSSTPKVSRYCTSETAKEASGWTNRKSNSPTLTTEASAAGPRPWRSATPTTASRKSMTMLVWCSAGNASAEMPAAAAQ